jgi:hypothetical protein
MQNCERCGKPAQLQTAQTKTGKPQTAHLCPDCVQIVCRPGTN